MKPKIISVKPLTDYRIWVKFEDNTEGVYDLSDLTGKGIYKVWNDYGYFNKVFINPENNAIAWNEDLEIDTLNCYLTIKGISFDQYKQLVQKEKHAIS